MAHRHVIPQPHHPRQPMRAAAAAGALLAGALALTQRHLHTLALGRDRYVTCPVCLNTIDRGPSHHARCPYCAPPD